MAKLKRFPFTVVPVSCKDIGYPEVIVQVNIDAPRRVLKLLLPELPPDWMERSVEEQLEYVNSEILESRFWAGLTEIVVDINVEGVDVSSPQALMESEDNLLPPRFWEKFVYNQYLSSRAAFFRSTTKEPEIESASPQDTQ